MLELEPTLPDLVPFNRRDFYRDRILAMFICLGLTGLVGFLAIELDSRGGPVFDIPEVVLTGIYKWEYRPALLATAPVFEPVVNPIETDVTGLEPDSSLQYYSGYLNRVPAPSGVASAATAAANGARVSSGTFVRSGPSRNHSSLGSLPAGTNVTILNTQGAWHQVNSGATTGWVWEGMLSDISVAPELASRPSQQGQLVNMRGRVSRQIALRAEPAGETIEVLPVLTEVTVSNHGEPSAHWLPVTVSGTEGWVYRGLVRLASH